MRHLVLGGVRSGKSTFSERWITEQSEAVTYIATSQIWDEGMAKRVEKHKAYRPDHWRVIEEPVALAKTLLAVQKQSPKSGVIVECCSLWLTNLLCQEDEVQKEAEIEAFVTAVDQFKSPLIMVSAEVGLGILPMNELARHYTDEIGVLNQRLATLCEHVTFVAAGLPMALKKPKS